MKPTDRWVLIGDMVHSRRVPALPAVRRQIEEALRQINATFASSIWAPFALTKGIDELSGVLLSPAPAFDILATLNLRIFPLRFRMALGYGEVRNLSAGREAGKMDGTAFHLAATALERARSNRLPLTLNLGRENGSELSAAIEALAALDCSHREKWPSAVRSLAEMLASGAKPGLTQEKIARQTERSQQAVSRASLRGRFNDLERAETAIRHLLAILAST